MKLEVLVTAIILAGCGNGDDDDAAGTPPPDTMPADTSTTTPDIAMMPDTMQPASDTAMVVDTAVADTAEPVTDTAPAPSDEPVPTNAAALFAYLKAGRYKSFAHESSPHASSGPHGNVQVYINGVLDRSLAEGGTQHPAGAAAVKELWSGSTLFGWAVEVKTAATSNGGGNWYWFELFSTTDVSGALEGKGLPGCTGCHSLGRDYFRSRYPLE